MAAPLGWLPSPRLDRARLAPPAGAPQRARAGGSSQRLSPGTPAPPLLRPQPCCMLAPHFLSPSFFSSLHPSPCRQNPPLKHNDNNTPAASACRACVYALARCLPACRCCCCWRLPLRLPSLPVGRTANGIGTASAGDRCCLQRVLPLLGPRRAGAGGSGAGANADSPCDANS